MSPARSDDPLRRVTLNLYEADCKFLEETCGHGWTTLVRDLTHFEAEKRRKQHTQSPPFPPRTLGDLADD